MKLPNRLNRFLGVMCAIIGAVAAGSGINTLLRTVNATGTYSYGSPAYVMAVCGLVLGVLGISIALD